jgi:outer membrane protein assembly factor BamA
MHSEYCRTSEKGNVFTFLHSLPDEVGLLRSMMLSLLVTILFASSLSGQVQSRTAEIEAARQEKSQALRPDEPSKAERGLTYFRDHKILERISAGIAGFRVKLGGVVQGGGFALGPEYLRRDLANGNLIFRTAAQSSIKAYERFDLEFNAPHFAKEKLFFDFFSVYHNYPGVTYYGPGPNSKKTARSNFRLEDTALDAAFGVQPVRGLRFGLSGGYLFANVGPGTDSRFVSSEKVFTPAQAPGIDRQGNFLRYGAFAQFDYRDLPGGPRRGGNYAVRYDIFSDQTLNRHDFRRLDISLEQYIPFFNQRRVLALRGKSVLTDTDPGKTVPFYLQPTLGGSDDLRGFRAFRFSDNNLIVVNCEYRWEVFSGLDMALFADAGKVFPRHADWNFRNMEAAFGFGFRFNVRNNVFMRLDTGFSHEGFQVWVKFNNVFGEERVRSSRFQ